MWGKCGRAGEATDDNIIRRMRCACWITKATPTHSGYVILIAFSRRQWVTRKRLNITLYVHCLFNCIGHKMYQILIDVIERLCDICYIVRDA